MIAARAVRRLPPIRRLLGLTATYLGANFIALVMMFPLLWMFSSSFKTKLQILSETRVNLIPPLPLQWHNYVDAWRAMDFNLYLLNTLIITTASLVGGLLTASLVAYGFARLRFRGRDVLFLVLLGTMMLPGQVTTIPTFLLFHSLGWLNTFLPLIVPYWLGGGAFYVFLIRQFIMSIPSELDDAARVDGCSPPGVYRHVILPNISPALATAAIFMFVATWNDLWGPLIYLTDQRMWTLAAGMLQFKRSFGSMDAGGTVQQFNLHWMMAMGTITMLPVLIFYLAFQRYFISGVVMSGIKG